MPQAYCRPCQKRVEIDNLRTFNVERKHSRKDNEPRVTTVPWVTGTCPQCGRRVTSPASAALQPEES